MRTMWTKTKKKNEQTNVSFPHIWCIYFIWRNAAHLFCEYGCVHIVFHALMLLFCVLDWHLATDFKMQHHYHYHVCMLSGNIERLWWINLQRERTKRATSGNWWLEYLLDLPKRQREGEQAIFTMPIESVAKQATWRVFFSRFILGSICSIITLYWVRNHAFSMRIVWLVCFISA